MSPSGIGSPTSSATRSRSALCEHGAAAMDPDDGETAPARLLDDLVRDAHERAPHVLGVEDDLVAHFAPSWPLWTGLKGLSGELAAGDGGTALAT